MENKTATVYNNNDRDSSMQASKKLDASDFSDRSDDSALFMKFEASSFEEGDVEMVPMAFFGGWQFPWNRSPETPDQRPSNESLLVSVMSFVLVESD